METATAVSAFQSLAGNRAVASLLAVQRDVEGEGEPGKRPNLDVGDTGDGVKLLQRMLTKVGYPVPTTGTFGRLTHEAAVRFQTDRPSLHPATGGVGRGTWTQLDAEIAGSPGLGRGELRTAGTSRIDGLRLGFIGGVFCMYGVEISFAIARGAAEQYGGLIIRQWSGPEAKYVSSDAEGANWKKLHQGPGGGADDPGPDFQKKFPDSVVYYDSPGMDIIRIKENTPDFRRAYLVQNFTGWIEGARSGQRLTEMIAWHSVLDLKREGDLSVKPTDRTRAGTGWVSLDTPT